MKNLPNQHVIWERVQVATIRNEYQDRIAATMVENSFSITNQRSNKPFQYKQHRLTDLEAASFFFEGPSLRKTVGLVTMNLKEDEFSIDSCFVRCSWPFSESPSMLSPVDKRF